MIRSIVTYWYDEFSEHRCFFWLVDFRLLKLSILGWMFRLLNELDAIDYTLYHDPLLNHVIDITGMMMMVMMMMMKMMMVMMMMMMMMMMMLMVVVVIVIVSWYYASEPLQNVAGSCWRSHAELEIALFSLGQLIQWIGWNLKPERPIFIGQIHGFQCRFSPENPSNDWSWSWGSHTQTFNG